jgi:hypothetical protein
VGAGDPSPGNGLLAQGTFGLDRLLPSLSIIAQKIFMREMVRCLYGVSTVIYCRYGDSLVTGTGFFYNKLSTPEEEKPGWVKVESIWLISNRHVIFHEERFPDELIFCMRKKGDSGMVWEEIRIGLTDLQKRTKLHESPEIDVATIQVDDLITKLIQEEHEKTQNKVSSYVPVSGISDAEMPQRAQIPIDVGDDVLIVGYPHGFYDKTNLFPIVKSGIIATPWDLDFDGKPCFLIDAKLFPGSSGSVVITKPINIKVEGDRVMYSAKKKYAFLGVYSGEPYLERKPIDLGDFEIVRKESFNVGVVWRSTLVQDLISKP